MKKGFASLINTRGKRLGAGIALIILTTAVFGTIAFRYITTASVIDKPSPPSAEAFLENTPDEALKKILTDADFLTSHRNLDRFDSVSELTLSDIFNLYASTDEIQARMNKEPVSHVELSAAEIEEFYSGYFRDYPFNLQKLMEERGNLLMYKNDADKDTLLFSTINGGVYWPPAMDSEITIDSRTPEDGMLTVNATRHYYEPSALMDDYYKITLTLRITDGGFNYVSYSSEKVADNAAQDRGISKGDIPNYFIVNGSFVGAYEGGKWVSLVDPHAQTYTPESFHPFLIKDLLNRGYTHYSREKSLGQAKEATLYAGLGPSGFQDGDKTEAFAPFAKKIKDGMCTFTLPVLLSGGELDTLTVPTDYGFSIFMGIDTDIEGRFNKPALATNASIPPPDGIRWTDTISSEAETALQKVLTGNNVLYSDPEVTAATGDFDSDGKPESIIYSCARRDPNGYLKFSNENKTLFSVILLEDDDGSYQTVYTRFMPYTEDITAYFRTIPIGVFDLNGDGIHEVCATDVNWESGSTFVLSRNTQGAWEQVLLSLWGT